ncbi:alpha/beta fold hydrolase [Exiguobacterium oxidotolerans]|uniref:Alpha/beta hydrolase n=1 Tax=Exiguobacterium oxidotolerans TaxID=223958 RepID=A0A653ICR3_9BACL|nr:alpha/beta hydrolase [Exiguobacterium oxidotolerans]VWX36740.1 Alpha/beta hydrolase [Exiguobacterium oxidotolerans]
MSKQTLVLLHGFAGGTDYFNRVEAKLRLSFDVLPLRLPGHEGEDVGPDTVEGFAEWVMKDLERREIENPIIVGHSFGGYITAAIVEAYADKISGFGLVYSTAKPDATEAKQKRNQNISRVEEIGVRAFVDGMIPGLFAEGADPMLISEAKEIGYMMTVEGAIRALSAMRDRRDVTSALNQTSVPGVIVHGEKDALISKESAFSPNNSRISFESTDSGHMGMLETPDAFCEIIERVFA